MSDVPVNLSLAQKQTAHLPMAEVERLRNRRPHIERALDQAYTAADLAVAVRKAEATVARWRRF
ncbi:hypothetical protein [Streptomyces sp. NPDC101165]|uniref:hypothetical protein n=1 Tax=Streptomyces sp. NPDC101165 TaxID=3366119 RepID=UPI00381BC0F0